MSAGARDLDHGLAVKVAALRRADTYPSPPGPIRAIETHMSWVFLGDRLAYKMKKPVRHDYLDFSTLAAREHYCREELRLNPRLAPGVYFGVVPLVIAEGGAMRLEVEGDVLDWLVKMRRLDGSRMLDGLIRARALGADDIEGLARVLVDFYREAAPCPLNGGQYGRDCEAAVQLNGDLLAEPLFELPPSQLARAQDAQREWLVRESDLLEERGRRLMEGHGDLRPEHVCLEAQPVIYDRLEFNRKFRVIDPVDELSFLGMECERLGAPSLGETLYDRYAAALEDHPPAKLRRYYTTYRACLRARLAAQHICDRPRDAWPHWLAEARAYLDIADRHARALEH